MSITVDEKRKQLSNQCRVIAYLANAISEVYRDKARIYAASSPADKLIDRDGSRSAGHMEVLGDILNSMDAVMGYDEWTDPIFESAQRIWPGATS